jgi:hypothetical protein
VDPKANFVAESIIPTTEMKQANVILRREARAKAGLPEVVTRGGRQAEERLVFRPPAGVDYTQPLAAGKVGATRAAATASATQHLEAQLADLEKELAAAKAAPAPDPDLVQSILANQQMVRNIQAKLAEVQAATGADKLAKATALRETIEAQIQERTAAVGVLENRLNEVIPWLPNQLGEDVEIITGGGARAAKAGSPLHQRSTVFPKGTALEGVPMTTLEREAWLKRGGTGTKATAYQDIEGEISVMDALKGIVKPKALEAMRAERRARGQGRLAAPPAQHRLPERHRA